MIKKYKWKKTAWKLVKVFIYGGIGALIAWVSNLPPSPIMVSVIAALAATENYLKHNNNRYLNKPGFLKKKACAKK